MKVGWIGLGGIGTHMVKRALASGHRVSVYARGRGLEEVEEAGAQVAMDYASLAAQSEVLTLCVYSDAQLRSVLWEHGALAALTPGSVLAIHTTGSSALARKIGRLAPENVAVLDAAFSGGPSDAAAGKLTLMIGGEARVIERVQPLFAAYAERIRHVGELGQGRMLKLLNNLLFAANLQNAVEIARIAAKQGFSMDDCARVIQDCSGASYANGLLQGPAPAEGVLSRARPYLAKDLATVLANAAEAGIDLSAFTSTALYYESP